MNVCLMVCVVCVSVLLNVVLLNVLVVVSYVLVRCISGFCSVLLLDDEKLVWCVVLSSVLLGCGVKWFWISVVVVLVIVCVVVLFDVVCYVVYVNMMNVCV